MSQYCQPRCVMVVMSVMTAGLLQPFVNCHSSYMFIFTYLFLFYLPRPKKDSATTYFFTVLTRLTLG